jgi:hypothetical protein
MSHEQEVSEIIANKFMDSNICPLIYIYIYFTPDNIAIITQFSFGRHECTRKVHKYICPISQHVTGRLGSVDRGEPRIWTDE